jgi:hypothetical protein
VRVVVDALLAGLAEARDLHLAAKALLAELPSAEASAAPPQALPRRKTSRSRSEAAASKA